MKIAGSLIVLFLTSALSATTPPPLTSFLKKGPATLCALLLEGRAKSKESNQSVTTKLFDLEKLQKVRDAAIANKPVPPKTSFADWLMIQIGLKRRVKPTYTPLPQDFSSEIAFYKSYLEALTEYDDFAKELEAFANDQSQFLLPLYRSQLVQLFLSFRESYSKLGQQGAPLNPFESFRQRLNELKSKIDPTLNIRASRVQATILSTTEVLPGFEGLGDLDSGRGNSGNFFLATALGTDGKVTTVISNRGPESDRIHWIDPTTGRNSRMKNYGDELLVKWDQREWLPLTQDHRNAPSRFLYFREKDTEKSSHQDILRYDLTNNRFSLIHLPSKYYSKEWFKVTELEASGETLLVEGNDRIIRISQASSPTPEVNRFGNWGIPGYLASLLFKHSGNEYFLYAEQGYAPSGELGSRFYIIGPTTWNPKPLDAFVTAANEAFVRHDVLSMAFSENSQGHAQIRTIGNAVIGEGLFGSTYQNGYGTRLKMVTYDLNTETTEVTPFSNLLRITESTAILVGGKKREALLIGVDAEDDKALLVYRVEDLSLVERIELPESIFSTYQNYCHPIQVVANGLGPGNDLIAVRTFSGKIIFISLANPEIE